MSIFEGLEIQGQERSESRMVCGIGLFETILDALGEGAEGGVVFSVSTLFLTNFQTRSLRIWLFNQTAPRISSAHAGGKAMKSLPTQDFYWLFGKRHFQHDGSFRMRIKFL
ncbi:MAG: hypothetical protein ACRERU_20115 [Methylococcales bacterium]